MIVGRIRRRIWKSNCSCLFKEYKKTPNKQTNKKQNKTPKKTKKLKNNRIISAFKTIEPHSEIFKYYKKHQEYRFLNYWLCINHIRSTTYNRLKISKVLHRSKWQLEITTNDHNIQKVKCFNFSIEYDVIYYDWYHYDSSFLNSLFIFISFFFVLVLE